MVKKRQSRKKETKLEKNKKYIKNILMSNKQRIRNRKYNDAVKRTNDARKIGFNKSDRLVKGLDMTKGIKMTNREKIRNNTRRPKKSSIHKLDSKNKYNNLTNKLRMLSQWNIRDPNSYSLSSKETISDDTTDYTTNEYQMESSTYNDDGCVNWTVQLFNNDFVYGINPSVKNSSSNGYMLGQFTGPFLQVGEAAVLESDTSAIFIMESDDTGEILSAYKLWDYNGVRPNYQFGQALFTSNDDNIIVISTFVGNVTFINGLTISDSNGSTFLAMFDLSGNLQGNPIQISADSLNDIYFTLDSNDNVYVCGTFVGRITIDTQTSTSNLDSSAFISRINTDGTVPWLLVATGTGRIFGEGIDYSAIDNTIVCVGAFTGTFILNGNTVSLTNELGNTWIAKLNLNGEVDNLISPTHPASENPQDLDFTEATQVVVDDDGYVYVTGDMFGNFFFGEQNLIEAINTRVFVTRLDSGFNWDWATSLEVSFPADVKYQSKLTVVEPNNIIVLTNFGFGDITYFMPEDDGSEEIVLECQGSGTLDLIISTLNIDGEWINTNLIPGAVENVSIDIVSTGNDVYLTGSRCVTSSRTDGFLSNLQFNQ